MFEDAAMIGKFDGAAAAVVVVIVVKTTGSGIDVVNVKVDDVIVDVVNVKVDDVIVIVCSCQVWYKCIYKLIERGKKNGEKTKYHFDECLFHEPIPHFLLSAFVKKWD